MTKQTYKELERELRKKSWGALLIVIIAISGLTIVGIQKDKLQSENEDLQFKLRTYNWDNKTLEFWYICNDGHYQSYWKFNDYGDYMNAQDVLKNLNCEVIK